MKETVKVIRNILFIIIGTIIIVNLFCSEVVGYYLNIDNYFNIKHERVVFAVETFNDDCDIIYNDNNITIKDTVNNKTVIILTKPRTIIGK